MSKSIFDQKPRLLEGGIQPQIVNFAHVRGWFCDKIESRSRRGIMDLLCIRRGRVIFIEVKRPGEEPSEQQARRAKEMRDHGAEVFAVDSLDHARQILQ